MIILGFVEWCALVVEKEKYGVFNQNRNEGVKDLSALRLWIQFLDFYSNALVMKIKNLEKKYLNTSIFSKSI